MYVQCCKIHYITSEKETVFISSHSVDKSSFTGNSLFINYLLIDNNHACAALETEMYLEINKTIKMMLALVFYEQ